MILYQDIRVNRKIIFFSTKSDYCVIMITFEEIIEELYVIMIIEEFFKLLNVIIKRDYYLEGFSNDEFFFKCFLRYR